MPLVKFDALSFFLLGLAVLMTSIGGFLDMTNQQQIGCITKQHLWHDGVVILLLLILYLLTK